MQELPDKLMLLVGHSMGAMLALAIATVRPQKIKELILVELPLPTEPWCVTKWAIQVAKRSLRLASAKHTLPIAFMSKS
ncbi:MAG: alpha/beta hydrolase [Trichodesmium sp. MAG_R03]|nr:alpha/beta hydrolase [Trichodesmium sp. MAG_R03]